jgi:exodeoxyribonuclease X
METPPLFSSSKETKMLIRVVDFETTGFPPDAAVCEVGWCDVKIADGAASVGQPQAMLVNPNRPMPAEARAIHHISDADLAGAPPITTGFLALTKDKPDVFVAHNAKFEREFFTGAGIPWICTRKVGIRLWPDAPNHQNQTLRYFLEIDNDLMFDEAAAMPPHRAGPDTYVTAHIFAHAWIEATIEDMMKWTDRPSLLPGAMNFGKHKGVLWSACDRSYLQWIVKQPDMDEDKKFTAQHYLAASARL